MNRISTARNRIVHAIHRSDRRPPPADKVSKIEDFVLNRLSRLVVDALDCVAETKPFNSMFLENNYLSILTLIDDEIESNEATNPAFFALAHSLIVLFTEMKGSYIGKWRPLSVPKTQPRHTLPANRGALNKKPKIGVKRTMDAVAPVKVMVPSTKVKSNGPTKEKKANKEIEKEIDKPDPVGSPAPQLSEEEKMEEDRFEDTNTENTVNVDGKPASEEVARNEPTEDPSMTSARCRPFKRLFRRVFALPELQRQAARPSILLSSKRFRPNDYAVSTPSLLGAQLVRLSDPSPGNGDAKPANGDAKPGGGDAKPANGDAKPEIEISKPANGAAKTGSTDRTPRSGATTQGSVGSKPANVAAKPGNGVAYPRPTSLVLTRRDPGAQQPRVVKLARLDRAPPPLPPIKPPPLLAMTGVVATADHTYPVVDLVSRPLKYQRCRFCSMERRAGFDMDAHVSYSHAGEFTKGAIRCTDCSFRSMDPRFVELHMTKFVCSVCGEMMASCLKTGHLEMHELEANADRDKWKEEQGESGKVFLCKQCEFRTTDLKFMINHNGVNNCCPMAYYYSVKKSCFVLEHRNSARANNQMTGKDKGEES